MPHLLDTNEEARLRIMAALEAVGEASASFESVANGIRDHDETYYVKPASKGYANMAEIAIAAAKEEQEIINPVRTFNYRPYDGAHATAKVLYEVWGYPGFGKTIPATMFSPERPPERITINVEHDKTIEVPWGWLALPDLKATLKLGATRDREKGILYELTVECPKLMEKAVRGLFEMIERELAKSSIYKGKAITAAEQPEFIDLTKLKPHEIVFRKDVQDALEHEVWFAIENMAIMKRDGQSTRWVTMLDGPYGTGKTLASMLTALRCQENDITFIQVRPGVDDLKMAMQTAALYSPAVVAFEDVDTVANPESSTKAEISRLLESFDGIRSKNADVQVIMTTNHSDQIHAGLLRAGRLNTYIKFGDLDAESLHQLLVIKVGEHRLVNIDKERLYRACEGYEPAFMDLVISVSRRYALSRNRKRLMEKGENSQTQALDYRISTEDLESAAVRLRPQHELMQDATKKKDIVTLGGVFEQTVREAIHGVPMVDSDGDVYATLKHDPDRIAAFAAKN